MKQLFLVFSIFFNTIIFSQNILENDKCICSDVFKEVIAKLEVNYLKYKEFELANNLEVYNQQKILFKKIAPYITANNCTAFIGLFLKL